MVNRDDYGEGTMIDSLAGTLVLLSGGIDSATALALATHQAAPSSALFIDYGQAAAAAEARSSLALARYYGVPYRRLLLSGLHFESGEIRGRNTFFLHAALLALDTEGSVVTIAMHSGTPYRDCTPDFVELMQRSYEFHTAGAVTLAVPFIDLVKSEVFDLALELKVPLQLTHSCEASNRPCRQCLSCLDREALFARP
jgi:7-cyano-7-deazaguanine synthase